MDTGLLGKVNLPPVPGATQLPDPLSRRRTDVSLHPFIIGIAFALYLVDTLFGVRKGWQNMKSMAAIFLMVCFAQAFAKDKSKIIIQVVKTEMKSGEYTYTTSGRRGTAETSCATSGNTNGTISDYGVGPIQTHSTDSASTNCTTTTTAATPPQTHVTSATLEAVTAIMQDGSRVVLFCEYGAHRCDYLAPGNYSAEIDGNALQVYVPDLSGKIRKVKYKAVVVERGNSAQLRQPVSSPMTALPSTRPRANSNPTPPHQSIAVLKEQAETGDSNAEIILADLYIEGDDVPKDYPQAVAWFRKAAEQGSAKAQAALGMIYGSDEVLPHDHQQSAIWWRKAAEQGVAEAQYNLGLMVWAGLGVPRDHAQADFWYSKAAEQGYAEAQVELGLAYYKGDGLPQDYAQAAAWYRKAAVQGNATAQTKLGALSALGQGVPQDWAESYFWLDLAASGQQNVAKPEEATKFRDDAASHLTKPVLLQTQERARKWFEDHPAMP